MSRAAFVDMLGSAKSIFEQALKERASKEVDLKVREKPPVSRDHEPRVRAQRRIAQRQARCTG
jgi:hypothetical protein